MRLGCANRCLDRLGRAAALPRPTGWRGLSVVVHGCSLRNRAEDAELRPSFPEPVSGWFVVRLMRTGVTGRAGLYPYSPTDHAILAARGYDEWAPRRVDPLTEDPK